MANELCNIPDDFTRAALIPVIPSPMPPNANSILLPCPNAPTVPLVLFDIFSNTS